MSKFTSLGRPLDPTYPTNIAIMVFTGMAGIIGGVVGLLNELALVDAALAGVLAAAAVFLAWALGREIDPDNELSAFVGAALALLAALVFAPLNLLALLTTMLLLRVVNRTVGPPARLGDTVIAVILSIVVIFQGQWVFGLVAISAFVLDAMLVKPLRAHVVAAAITGAAMLTYIAVNGAGSPGELTVPFLFGAVAIGVFFLIVTVMTRAVHSLSDATHEPLNVRRIRGAMGLALLAGAVLLWHGDGGLMMMAPLWAAMLGTAIFRLFNMQTTNEISIVRTDRAAH